MAVTLEQGALFPVLLCASVVAGAVTYEAMIASRMVVDLGSNEELFKK